MRYLLYNGYNLSRRIRLCLFANNSYNSLLTRWKSEHSCAMKYLNVAEKNDAAKNIAAHLSRGTSNRREGFSQYNKIYEFEAEVFGQKSKMVMTSVSGHLLALEFVGTYKQWQGCAPLALFDAPVFKYCPENYEKIKRTLEHEVRTCDGLIIWTDCDREGENIGYEIIQVCTAVKNNLRIFRAKFSEITAVSVRRALSNLEQPNKNISDAVDVRQELDLRIGAAFTRFQTLRLQKVFPSKLAESLISYGSCQFPTLGFVVERYRAVESFVAEPFWKIKVNHTMNGLSVDFAWERVRLFDELACQVLHDMCTDNPLAKVVDVKTKPKSKWRPLPLDTVELEKLASRKLKINAKETMRIAEKLYTQGLISYPRTETNEFPKEMNMAQLVGLHTGDPSWGSFAQGILDSGGPTPRQGNKSDKAHPPIHPTKHASNLSGNEKRLYEFIVRSFLACCSKDAQGQETSVSIEVAAERFNASGLMITARNYLEVYPYDKWSSKEIHVYEIGQTFNPTSIDMVDGTTSPPNLLTEADLIALMEKHGIGTDATHADHIETIKNRSYVALADAIHFVPGLLGMGLVEGYDAMSLQVGISKPHLRAQLEADLKAICEGRKQPQQVLAEQIAIYREVYLTVTAEAIKIDNALAERFSERPNEYTPGVDASRPDMPSPLRCPKCGSDMVVRSKKNSDEVFISCPSYPSCKNAVWFPSLVKSLQVLSDTCPTCGPNFKKIKFEWRNNSISHLYPPPYVGCVGGCDMMLLELMNINLSCVKNTSTQTQTSRQGGTTQSTVFSRNSNPQNRNPTIPVGPNVNPRQNSNMTVPTAPTRPNPFQSANTRLTTNPPRQFQPPNANRGQSNPGQFLPPPTVNRGQNNPGPRMPAPRGGSFGNDADDNNVICGCNQPAILLTVRKQTTNFGKKFYKCPVGKENGGCDFFLWAPENVDSAQTTDNAASSWGNNSQAGNTSGWGNSGGGQQGSNWGSGSGGQTRGWGTAPPRGGDGDGVSCDCGLQCKRITVHKEGPNKGREFYSCPKDYNARCKFFQWADEGGSGGSSTEWGMSSTTTTSRGRGSRGGGRGGRGGGAGRGGARKCSLCQLPGHTRNRCPNAGDD